MKRTEMKSFRDRLDENPSVRIIGRELKGAAQGEFIDHDWTANKTFDMRPFPIGFIQYNRR